MTSWVVYRHPKTGRFSGPPRGNRPRVPVVFTRDPDTGKVVVAHVGRARRSRYDAAEARRRATEEIAELEAERRRARRRELARKRREALEKPPVEKPFRVYYGSKTPWNLVRVKFRVVRNVKSRAEAEQLKRKGLLQRDVFWISGRIDPTRSRATGRSLVESLRDFYLEIFLSKGYDEELTPLLGSVVRVAKYRMRIPAGGIEQVRPGRRR